jgi:methyl-accepting chemotaxis protein
MNSLISLYKQMKSNSEDADQAATLGGRARDSASQGYQALEDVQETLNNFVSSADNVGELLAEIQSLSHQVHILGVNAAIEAANAGEQGAGFSIIANEMRRIAAKVTDTTVDVQHIMEITGALADKTVSAIETASESLELLEVSADLSVNLTSAVAVSAQDEYEALSKLFPDELSPERLQEELTLVDDQSNDGSLLE